MLLILIGGQHLEKNYGNLLKIPGSPWKTSGSPWDVPRHLRTAENLIFWFKFRLI